MKNRFRHDAGTGSHLLSRGGNLAGSEGLLTELNDKQIAATLGRSHGAVRTAHWRLLSKLRECLGSPPGQMEGGAVHA